MNFKNDLGFVLLVSLILNDNESLNSNQSIIVSIVYVFLSFFYIDVALIQINVINK